jgi:hypothetical protein
MPQQHKKATVRILNPVDGSGYTSVKNALRWMQQKPPIADDFLTDAEAACILRVGPGTVRRWRTKGIGPRYCRLVGRVFYLSHDVADYIRSLLTGGGAPVNPRSEAG